MRAYYCHRVVFALAFASVLIQTIALAQQAPSAATRMNELGPENAPMAQRVGIWDVVERFRPPQGLHQSHTSLLRNGR